MNSKQINVILFVMLLTICPSICTAGAGQPADNPETMVLDGAHMGGNPDFFFLPPLVSDPANHAEYDAGDFDSTLTPTVKICMMEDNVCAPTQPQGFPLVFTSGEGSDSVRVNVEDELYIVNWKTNKSDSLPEGVYRISVFVGNALLGFADVLVINSMKDAKKQDTSDSFVMAAGRTLPIKFRIEKSGIVGPEGGILEFDNGIVFDVPAGAVDEYTLIKLGELPLEHLQYLLDIRPYKSSEKSVLGGFTAEPDGLIFNVPVKVTLPISAASPGGIPIQVVMDLEAEQYWISPTDMIYDPETGLAEITLTHFSGQAVVNVAGADVALPEGCDEGRIRVVSQSSDFSGGSGCQVVGDYVEVTFLDCPGQPTQSVHISETTPECGEDFNLTIQISPKTIKVCRSDTFHAQITDQNGNEWDIPLTWTSSDPSVARIHPADAIVTGTSHGFAQIKAQSPDPRFYGTSTVTVAPIELIVQPSAPTLEVGETVQLEAVDDQENPFVCDVRSVGGFSSSQEAVTWSCFDFDETVATIDSQTGLVTAVAPGTAIIMAESGNAMGFAEIEVVGTTVDIVFVFDILWSMEPELIYGFNQWGSDIVDDLSERFANYQVAIVTHAHYDTYIDPTPGICGQPSTHPDGYAPFEPASDVLPFTWDSHADDIISAFSGIKYACDAPEGWVYNKQSTSVYTALLHAIDGQTLGGWGNDSEGIRAIIMVGDNPVCYKNFSACDVEPVSGYSSWDVVTAANAKDIRIYGICTRGSGGWASAMMNTFGPLTFQTGGKYYHSSGSFSGIYSTLIGILDDLAANNIIYGSVNSLSPSAIFTPDDETPPTISDVSAYPDKLWPPNHKTVEVLISGSVIDEGTGIEQVWLVVWDEYGELTNDFCDIKDQVNQDGGFNVPIELIASRDDNDMDGRQYTICVCAIDRAENEANSDPIDVVVSQGK